MKLILPLTFLISFSSFAGARQEYDEKMEKVCHQELKTLGCLKDDEEMKDCAEMKKEKLSQKCKTLHEVQMKNK